ncbi:putative Lipase, class 3, partial [Pseudohyphozyma bogoriensis]
MDVSTCRAGCTSLLKTLLDKLVRRADLWLEAKIPWLKRAQRLVDLPRYAAPPVQVPALDDFQRFSYSIHAQDLQELHDKCPKGPLSKVFHWISHNDASAFVKQIIITGSGLAFTIASNPLDFIADPITVAYSIFGYSLIFTVLFWFQIFLFCYRNFGIQRLMKSVSREYMGGMSFVNCSQPEMFDEVQVVAQGAKVLGKKKYEVPQFTGLDVHSLVASMTHRRTKVFDIDVARTLLLFSASVYERDDEMVQKASEIVEESEERAIEFLKKSEEKILNFAAQWGVRYAAISDCASIGGSYAGVYYSDPEKLKDGEQPWICVVVKGTGPFNFEEWLIDASASKEDAGDWLTGSCHRG